MLDSLKDQTTKLEQKVLASVFEIHGAAMDTARTTVQIEGGFLQCRFFSVADAHCPFELHFGRDDCSGKFNFFVGAGAEIANFESLATEV